MTVEPAPARRRGLGRLGPAGPPLLLLAAMWILETIDVVLRGWLDNGGIQPRESDGLLGILFAPLLHGGFDHLLSNTIPLLVLGTLVATGGRAVFWKVTGVVVLLGGLARGSSPRRTP